MPGKPTLPGVNWEGYSQYLNVLYDPLSWGSRHWVCPQCGYITTVLHNKCGGCFRERVKKITGYNRVGNPVEKWVMLK